MMKFFQLFNRLMFFCFQGYRDRFCAIRSTFNFLSYHSHADAEKKRDDGIAAVGNPCKCVAFGVPKNVVQQRPFSGPLLTRDKDSPGFDVRVKFSKQTRNTTELKRGNETSSKRLTYKDNNRLTNSTTFLIILT